MTSYTIKKKIISKIRYHEIKFIIDELNLQTSAKWVLEDINKFLKYLLNLRKILKFCIKVVISTFSILKFTFILFQCWNWVDKNYFREGLVRRQREISHEYFWNLNKKVTTQ